MNARSNSVTLQMPAGTLKVTLSHGYVYCGWRPRGARVWETDRKTMDEAEEFFGTMVDHLTNERILRRRELEGA